MTSRRTDIDDSDVHFMYEVEGMSQQKIADYYGVCQMTIFNRLNPENMKEHNDKYHTEHRENDRETSKQYRLEHPEYSKEHYQDHIEETKEYNKQWRQENPDKAQERDRKVNDIRRDLCSIELNKPFPDSEGHHIDTEHIIHIPKELHQSIRHNVRTGEGMVAINAISFQYITEETFDNLIGGDIYN